MSAGWSNEVAEPRVSSKKIIRATNVVSGRQLLRLVRKGPVRVRITEQRQLLHFTADAACNFTEQREISRQNKVMPFHCEPRDERNFEPDRAVSR